jgi:oligoendopeptidase F
MKTETSHELDFNKLPPFEPRRFVPFGIDLNNIDAVSQLFKQLLDRPVFSRSDLEQWVMDRSELDMVLDQHGSVLYIRMTCQTDDASRADAYRAYIEHMVPAIKPLVHQLNAQYARHSGRFPLDSERFRIYDRAIQTDLSLFVDQNIPLQTKENLLSQDYQTLMGRLTAHFRGHEYTLPQMGKFLEDPDRTLREEAWRAAADSRLKERKTFEDLFDQMLAIRVQIAGNAGCANYCDYKFKSLHRFDYTPRDCKDYHAVVEEHIVPLWKRILERRKQQMKLSSLRPWDLAVDPLGRPALKPFDHSEQLKSGARQIFQKLDANFGEQFTDMMRLGLLDLDSRKGKAPGGYQSVLSEARKPFIFMNAVGVDGDVWTLLHEGGHAFHAIAASQHPIFDYRHGPMEFNEVASMGMELLGSEYLSEFYKTEEDAKRSKVAHLEDIVYILLWVATVDAFQQWIYDHPRHSQEERSKVWVELHNRFGARFLDWNGLDDHQQSVWHRQLHIFEVPFYYIEYGIAQLGALQLWTNAREDRNQTLADYKKGLALGGSRPLPEIYNTAGLKFDFSADTIQPLMKTVARELF